MPIDAHGYVPPGATVTGTAEVRLEPGPDLTPPYYNESGELLTNYHDIREHQHNVVCAYVESEIDRSWTGTAATHDNLQAMKVDAVQRLMAHQAKGNIHPHARVWEWVDEDRLGMRWTERCDQHRRGDDGEFRWLARAREVQEWADQMARGAGDRRVDRDQWWWVDFSSKRREAIEEALRWTGNIWVPDLKTRAKDRLYARLRPKLLNHHGKPPRATQVSFRDAKENELVALRLLREMVDTEVFRKYLKHGFVTVRGPSGLTYQIRRRSHLIAVWDRGKMLCTLCVYLRDKIPPTDDVVAKMVICELDELDIWKRANVSWSAPKNEIEQNPRVLALGVQGRRSADENHRWQAA